MTKMPKFKHAVSKVPVDLGYGSYDEFTLAELRERIMSRQDSVISADPIDIDTVKLQLEHDGDRDSCWVNLKVVLTQTLTVQFQEQQWREREKANAEYTKKMRKQNEVRERQEYERLLKKFGGKTDP